MQDEPGAGNKVWGTIPIRNFDLSGQNNDSMTRDSVPIVGPALILAPLLSPIHLPRDPQRHGSVAASSIAADLAPTSRRPASRAREGLWSSGGSQPVSHDAYTY